MPPLVSVILPTYDRPVYLRRAVGSVIEQSYPNIELVIVDDCSPSRASESLQDIDLDSLSAYTLLRHETNKGQNAARNTGIDAATGDFIALLDDDDTWENEKLERQVRTFQESDDEVGVVYTGQKYIRDGSISGYSRSDASGDVTKYILAGGGIAPTSSVMVRSEIVEEAGPPDADCPAWTDREWYIRLSLHCTFEAIPEPLVRRSFDAPNQMSDEYELRRDVAYPYLVSKYRSLAAEYGLVCERMFLAATTRLVGLAAFQSGNYSDARRYLIRSILYSPIHKGYKMTLVYLFLSVGGKKFHDAARRAKSMYLSRK